MIGETRFMHFPLIWIWIHLIPFLVWSQMLCQARFRKRRSTVDHLHTVMLTYKITDEWKFPIWTAAVDFKKACDSVTQKAL